MDFYLIHNDLILYPSKCLDGRIDDCKLLGPLLVVRPGRGTWDIPGYLSVVLASHNPVNRTYAPSQSTYLSKRIIGDISGVYDQGERPTIDL